MPPRQGVVTCCPDCRVRPRGVTGHDAVAGTSQPRDRPVIARDARPDRGTSGHALK